MSKLFSDQLYRLIHAMNGSEKRYFQRYAQLHGGKESIAAKLFNAYSRLKTFDEASLVKSEKYLSGFAQHKKHLFELIMRSMRSYHALSTTDMQIRALIADSDILRQMRLHDAGLARLQKAKRMAERNENYLALLEIIRKTDEMRFDARTSIPFTEYTSVIKTEEELLESYREFARYKSYVKAMYSLHYADADGLRKFQKQIKAPSAQPRGFHALRYFLTGRTAEALLNGQVKQAYDYAVENVRTVERSPQLILDHPHEYMKALSSQLVLEDILRLHAKIFMSISKLRQLHRSPSTARKLKSFESHTFVYTYTSEINAHVQAAGFDEALRLIPVILKGLEKYKDKITPAEVKVFYLNFSQIFLYTGNPKMAYRWSTKAIDEMFAVRQDLNYSLLLVRLLSVYERNDPPFLLRLIKKDSPRLSQTGIATGLTKELLSFLTELAAQSSTKEKQEMLKAFLLKISSPKMKKDLGEISAHLELVAWLKGKLSKQTLNEVISLKNIH